MKRSPFCRLLLLFVLAISISGCLIDDVLLKTTEPPVSPQVDSLDWITVYFTDPDWPGAQGFRGGPDDALAAAIRRAQLSVDMAAYNLNLWSLRDALLAAHKKGVTVRLVVESDNLDDSEIQDLIEAGIKVLGDRREGLMHNKFVIIDRLEVWTGSMNFTTTDAYLNDNNLLRIRSSRLAEDYAVEFEEMFVEDLFGPDSRTATPYPRLLIEGTPVEVYFSPDDGTLERLLDLVDAAQESIYFLAYSFTSDELAAAMLDRAADRVTVVGVFERSQYESNIGTEFDNFRLAGVAVYLDGNPRNMHHKIIIIDEKIVVTGSYNFSANAENLNDENTLIFNSPEIATLYMQEFQRVLGKIEP